jgi:hypothetical protein
MDIVDAIVGNHKCALLGPFKHISLLDFVSKQKRVFNQFSTNNKYLPAPINCMLAASEAKPM